MNNIDLSTKKYLSNPYVFADIFNTYFLEGERIINPDNLTDRSTEEIAEIKGMKFNRFRDVMKVMKTDGDNDYLLLGIESQSTMDKAMPIRVANYDIMELQKQAQSNIKTIIPVITLVIYFKPGKWKGPKRISDLYEGVDKRYLPYMLDYKMNLLCPFDLSEEMLSKFKSDMGRVMGCIKYSKDSKKLNAYMSSGGSLSKNAVDVLNETIKIDLKIEENQEEVDMCVAMNEIKREWKIIGEKEGEIKGEIKGCVITYQELGISFEEMVKRIAKKFNLSEVEAETVSKQYWVV